MLAVRTSMHVVSTSLLIVGIQILGKVTLSCAMQMRRTWTTKHWCESVVKPEWPFAYSKFKNQREERKGRVLSNRQDVRHVCQKQGVASKCHICEDIQCGDNSTSQGICHFQLQGVSTDDMSKNIPTVSDVPWAVGGSHRYDYGGSNTSHVCMYMSGGECQSSFAEDYSNCELRCWGHYPNSSSFKNTAGNASVVEGESPGVWPNARSDYLNGVVMTPWELPSPSQTWSYPKQNADQSIGDPRKKEKLKFLPQGLTFTLAGDERDGEAGFVDGVGNEARFRHPEGVAVDRLGYVFVADTGNHAIRMISPLGEVTTIAGNGEPGFRNGYSSDNPQFTSPSSIAVWYDWEWWPYPNPIDLDSYLYRNGNGTLTLFVSDTGNHQIRKVTLNCTDNELTKERSIRAVNVVCFSGYCSTGGNDKYPRPGYADGSKEEARFDSPRGLAINHRGDIFVTDTNNHLIRKIDRFGVTGTIAGSTTISETNENDEALEGCPSPCLSGIQGRMNGPSLEASFSFPSDLALSRNQKMLFVTDSHQIRSIDLDRHKVDAIAGTNNESERDGFGEEASFNKPEGIAVTIDGYIYISDSASCRIRRAFYPEDLLPKATCSDSLVSLFRPSGCSSYNADSDIFGLKISSVSQNTYYNYLHRNITEDSLGEDFIGRGIKDCVGSPPATKTGKSENPSVLNEKLVVNDPHKIIREDPNEGSLITILCPPGCKGDSSTQSFIAYGDDVNQYFYAEYSSLCDAAIHSRIHQENEGGLVSVIIKSTENITKKNNFQSNVSSVWEKYGQVFTLKAPKTKLIAVNTISGASSILTESSCGQKDAIPPQGAKFRTPIGLAVIGNSTLDNIDKFLFIADRNNNAIRSISATCTFICENNGRCVGPDTCACKNGWEGIDCTKPICSDPCAKRQLCVAPDTCGCIPGYKGETCSKPTCVQSCEHGICSAPDTCTCDTGWFDTNCTTPVCEQTCGNGGNCTQSNTCSCPTDWKGHDCRIPVCEQQCGFGICVAPNTCQCPPDWSGFDCSQPVCHQGYFDPFPTETDTETKDVPTYWLEYRPCRMSLWCKVTKSFECDQNSLKMSPALPLSGPKWRYKTGRNQDVSGCVYIELSPDSLTWFQYLRSTNNTITPYMRYSIPSPHDGTSEFQQEWNTKSQDNDGFTSPWQFSIDRQVALVELINVTQGRYKCANNGRCVAPDTCSCTKGWMGFDCRVPICEQGYYQKDQSKFVAGTNDDKELKVFEKFMNQHKNYRLNPASPGYSNPSHKVVVERFSNKEFIVRSHVTKGGQRYLHEHSSEQGGYECSIRAVTEWENFRSEMFEHPNYYSHYMDQKIERDGVVYTHWIEMGWEPLYSKSVPLELRENFFNITNATDRIFLYTDEGHRRLGEWSRTHSNWTKGRCIVEFKRVCDDEIYMYDLEATDINGKNTDIIVQDTDLSFRARLNYDDSQAHLKGTWKERNGTCTDHVIRGCFNNGTCVGPNQCECAKGWTSSDCTKPTCEQPCLHNGNCTLPGICTCEKGWSGHDCSLPLCAQDCNNGGICIAPDTCKCYQWQNRWRDGRAEGGVPLFKTPNGDPQLTGWTGYDCSTPICVQAESFLLNVDTASYERKDLVLLGGHGKNGSLTCDKVKCPEYDSMVLSNNGKSFQTGCGNDPIISGCCYEIQFVNETVSFDCFKCRDNAILKAKHSSLCPTEAIDSWSYSDVNEIPALFKDRSGRVLRICGPSHNPGGKDGKDYYVSNEPFATQYWSNGNYESRLTSDQYLCNRHSWFQGDYIDNAGLGSEKGIGTDFGLETGRHTRVNFNNYFLNATTQEWKIGKLVPGEGIFACYNSGSCIAPDVCTCKDGYDGFDCKTPLCRHQQLDGKVVGCLNGGICIGKDKCDCIQTESILWKKHASADRGATGWTGKDCSNPICTQGYYDPLCTENPEAPGGEGCYRCANSGLCVAPDVCECSEGWTGFDCQTPVCETVATTTIKLQLMTHDEKKIRIFERDPCGMDKFDSRLIPNHMRQTRGKCTLPNQCTCFCKESYDFSLCRYLGGNYCVRAFQDPLRKYRDVLMPNEIFGTRSCSSGFEGAVDEKDKFISCHLNIYEPTFYVRYSISMICWGLFFTMLFIWFCFRIKRRRHERYMSAMYDKRRYRREGIVPNDHAFAFGSKRKTK